VELINADGALVRADAATNAELFWALRGGGGSFGVVTAVEFRMYPIESAYAGFLMWDIAETEPVLREWAAWAPGAPDEVTTSFRVMRMPEMPELPDFLRGREIAIIDGAVLGSDERGVELLAGLRALRPEMDTFGRAPAASLVRLHMDPEGGAPVASDSAMLGGFPDAAVDAFLAEVGPGVTTPLLMAELRQLGGALARPHAGGGVLSHLDAEFAMFAGALAMDAESGAAGRAAAGRLREALAPFANGRQYLNFAENPVDVASAYPDRAWRQLSGIRSAVDPDGRFVANHPVPRLYEQGRSTT
jgi:FAD/FMN-containing dehydrogenase